MLPRLRTIPDEIVECIAEGRAPDIFELLEVCRPYRARRW